MKTQKTPAAAPQTAERKPGKRYRGSAVLSHEGDFIFLSEDVRCETRVFFVCCHFCIFIQPTDAAAQVALVDGILRSVGFNGEELRYVFVHQRRTCWHRTLFRSRWRRLR